VGWGSWCTLEDQRATTVTLEGSDPGNQVVGDAAFPQDAGQGGVVDVVNACFDVQKKGGHLQVWPLPGFHVVHKGEAGIVGAQPGKGTELVGVNQPP